MLMDIRAKLEAAKDEVARLERMVAVAPCAEVGHRWVSIGGANAGCEIGADICNCSVPVNVCEICGDCDYGENVEADEIRAECKLRNPCDDAEFGMTP